MKRRKLASKLNLSKRTISNLKSSNIKGGSGFTLNCETNDTCLSQDEHLCEFTFYSACTGHTEPGVTQC